MLFKMESGVLSFISSPNFEHLVDTDHDGIYEVIVGVSDGDLGQDTQLIKVKVTDVNEAPEITSGGGGNTANYIISEDAFEHGRRGVTMIQAADPDKGDALKYSIVAGTGLDRAHHALFNIDKSPSNRSRWAPPVRETCPRFRLGPGNTLLKLEHLCVVGRNYQNVLESDGGVCTENLNPDVVMMESAEYRREPMIPVR